MTDQPPSFAASTRVKHVPYSRYNGQRRHDLREGYVPTYVDATCSHLNRVLIEPPSPSFMKQRTEELRQRTNPRRRMRANTAIATTGIITFGKGAQELFEALSPGAQDEVYRAITEKIAEVYKTTIRGLIVHADETAPHAHFMCDSRSEDGLLMSKIMKGSKLQDLVAEVVAEHVPGIVRGERKVDRMARGDDPSKCIHRSVSQLHVDLPNELSAKHAELKEKNAELKELGEHLGVAQQRYDEMLQRVLKLEAKEELTDKEVKRLETYRLRLADRLKALESAEEEARHAAEGIRRAAEERGRQEGLQRAEQEVQERKARQDAWEKDLEQRETTLSEQAQIVVERGLTLDAEEKELKRRQAAQESREIGFERAVELAAAGVLQLVNGRIRAPREHHEVLRPVMQTIVGGAIRKLLNIQDRLRNLLARNEVEPDLRDEAEELLGGSRPGGW